MAFRKTISQSELAEGLSDADRQQHGRTYSAQTGGWTETTTDKPTAGTGSTDQDVSGARKWWTR
ncbi:hypothetical protein GCM10010260_84190 [Streptomyces filipinensis]|uniref:Uncharacterized protein n=1 Tax=Streptomyces filipinensis TaxID=66887 RepID=A0A918IKF8_9ACTN|nr:hypothetical protein [Streptomyces filipinensis]GGV31043.1 hypothetical protein GCM10010260_84190 [Streptomyces filipinensis]